MVYKKKLAFPYLIKKVGHNLDLERTIFLKGYIQNLQMAFRETTEGDQMFRDRI